MKKEQLEIALKEATSSLLEMAREACWNNISDNCYFILSNVEDFEAGDFFEQRLQRKKLNDKKTPEQLEQIIPELEELFHNIYDLDLFIFKALKEKTIVEVQYLLKSALDDDYFQKVKENEPVLHLKIPIPPYAKQPKKKFDIN